MWASQELSHVECSYLISLDPPNDVKEKLHTLYWLSPRHCTEEVFSRIPNLETLKIRAINQNICLWNPQAFQQNLKELTLFHTRLRWKHINIIATMPSLQVLKLKREAVCDETWQPSDGGFRGLKFLLIDFCSQFNYWREATPEHYPVLERLVIRNCRLFTEFPDSFEDMITLRLIEISNCSPSLLNSAHRIQEAQKDLGNDGLAVRDATPLFLSTELAVLYVLVLAIVLLNTCGGNLGTTGMGMLQFFYTSKKGMGMLTLVSLAEWQLSLLLNTEYFIVIGIDM
nr:putative late blight resistance protein homolog R1B-16 [Ipomoea batatas]